LTQLITESGLDHCPKYVNFDPHMPRLPRIPDLLTTANLCCGVGSILLASQGQLTLACWLVFAGAFFDVLDGLAARALGGGSELGKQLDSLADMVTFGVAPGMLVYQSLTYLRVSVESHPLSSADLVELAPAPISESILVAMAISAVIPIASAWRLAKFNVDPRQTSGFLGLPTPANALFWASSCMPIFKHSMNPSWESGIQFIKVSVNPWATGIVAIVLAILMLSELPLPGLKFKHFKWRGNEVIFLLLGIGAVLVVLYGMLAVRLIMVLYILSPLWGRVFGKGG
jgi:CDP-diacylglycerol---serine O-phosphatidyltransferase